MPCGVTAQESVGGIPAVDGFTAGIFAERGAEIIQHTVAVEKSEVSEVSGKVDGKGVVSGEGDAGKVRVSVHYGKILFYYVYVKSDKRSAGFHNSD